MFENGLVILPENQAGTNPTGEKKMYIIDISQVDVGQPQDVITIRMNVDDFDEAYQLLLSHGFRNEFGDRVAETESSRNAVMSSPSGFAILLIQHIKG